MHKFNMHIRKHIQQLFKGLEGKNGNYTVVIFSIILRGIRNNPTGIVPNLKNPSFGKPLLGIDLLKSRRIFMIRSEIHLKCILLR